MTVKTHRVTHRHMSDYLESDGGGPAAEYNDRITGTGRGSVKHYRGHCGHSYGNYSELP